MRPVAQNWFEPLSMGQGITLIKEWALAPHAACNIWHIRGRDQDLVFDSGTGLVSLQKSLPHLLDRPVICVSSHSHFDHIGGSYEFGDRRMHAAEAEIICFPDRLNTTVKGFLTDDLFRAFPFEGFSSAHYKVKPAPPTTLLKEGDCIDLGTRRFAVVHLPGHSPGSIGLYDATNGHLFSGDAVLDGYLYDDVFHSHVPDWIKTMEKLICLEVNRVYAGHYGSFGGRRLKQLAQSYIRKKAEYQKADYREKI